MAHFFHGDFGFTTEKGGDIVWDGEGDEEPTDEDYEAAADYWDADDAAEYAREYADGLADYLYERMRDED